MLLAFLLVFILISIYVTPKEIVDYIGVENTYLVSFLLAVFGGLSTVTGVSFFTSVITFSSGGANPFLLGLLGGLGIFISDTIFFFAVRYGIKIFYTNTKPVSLRLVSAIKNVPLSIVLIGVYIYIGFTPLPNDILMIALALVGMSFKQLAPVLMAGSITVVTLVAYSGQIIFNW